MNRTEWNNVKLKDICSSQSSNISQNKIQHLEGNYPIFGASGFIQYVDFFKQDNEYIAIVKDGAGVGRVMRLPANSSVLGTLQYIIPNQNTDINYLFYLLNKLDLAKYASGATIPHIYFRDYSNEKVPFPSDIQTQRNIAATLDKANELIALRKKQLQELNTLAESVFYDVFKNAKVEIKELGEVVDIQSGLVDPTTKPYSDMIHVGGANIEKSSGNFVNTKLAKEEHLISGKYYFDETMILYSKIRPNLNKVALPEQEGICSADMYPLIPRPNIVNRIFIRYILVQSDFLEYAISHSGRANIPKINRKDLLKYKLPVPSLFLQNHFASIIEKIEAEKSLVLQALQESEGLFQRLMQDLFPKG